MCQVIAPTLFAPVFLDLHLSHFRQVVYYVISAVKQAHKTPLALGIFRVLLMSPELEYRPKNLLKRLPELLNLGLAAIALIVNSIVAFLAVIEETCSVYSGKNIAQKMLL